MYSRRYYGFVLITCLIPVIFTYCCTLFCGNYWKNAEISRVSHFFTGLSNFNYTHTSPSSSASSAIITDPSPAGEGNFSAEFSRYFAPQEGSFSDQVNSRENRSPAGESSIFFVKKSPELQTQTHTESSSKLASKKRQKNEAFSSSLSGDLLRGMYPKKWDGGVRTLPSSNGAADEKLTASDSDESLENLWESYFEWHLKRESSLRAASLRGRSSDEDHLLNVGDEEKDVPCVVEEKEDRFQSGEGRKRCSSYEDDSYARCGGSCASSSKAINCSPLIEDLDDSTRSKILRDVYSEALSHRQCVEAGVSSVEAENMDASLSGGPDKDLLSSSEMAVHKSNKEDVIEDEVVESSLWGYGEVERISLGGEHENSTATTSPPTQSPQQAGHEHPLQSKITHYHTTPSSPSVPPSSHMPNISLPFLEDEEITNAFPHTRDMLSWLALIMPSKVMNIYKKMFSSLRNLAREHLYAYTNSSEVLFIKNPLMKTGNHVTSSHLSYENGRIPNMLEILSERFNNLSAYAGPNLNVKLPLAIKADTIFWENISSLEYPIHVVGEFPYLWQRRFLEHQKNGTVITFAEFALIAKVKQNQRVTHSVSSFHELLADDCEAAFDVAHSESNEYSRPAFPVPQEDNYGDLFHIVFSYPGKYLGRIFRTYNVLQNWENSDSLPNFFLSSQRALPIADLHVCYRDTIYATPVDIGQLVFHTAATLIVDPYAISMGIPLKQRTFINAGWEMNLPVVGFRLSQYNRLAIKGSEAVNIWRCSGPWDSFSFRAAGPYEKTEYEHFMLHRYSFKESRLNLYEISHELQSKHRYSICFYENENENTGTIIGSLSVSRGLKLLIRSSTDSKDESYFIAFLLISCLITPLLCLGLTVAHLWSYVLIRRKKRQLLLLKVLNKIENKLMEILGIDPQVLLNSTQEHERIPVR